MRGVRANCVNRLSPVVVSGGILFAKVTRSHFVNTVKPRDATQLADCLCDIQPISWWFHIFYMLLCSMSEKIFKVVLLYLLFVSLFFTQQLYLHCKLPMS